MPLQVLIFHSIAVIFAQASDPNSYRERACNNHDHSMSKTLISKIARPSRHHGAAYISAIQQRRDFSATRNRLLLESAKALAPFRVTVTSTASIFEPPPLATSPYVPMTGLELFLAEKPSLKPFLLAGLARERAVTEAVIAWSEICDHVFHLIHGKICASHAGIMRTLRSRKGRFSGVKELSNSKRCVEIDSQVDETYNTRSRQDSFITFDRPPSFGREFMPFFFVFGERIHEKSGHEIDLENLRIKPADEKVSSAFLPLLSLCGFVVRDLICFLCFRMAVEILALEPTL